MRKKRIATVSILIVAWLTIWYSIWEFSSLNDKLENSLKENLKQQTVIEQLKTLSPIEIDEIELKTAQLDSEKHEILEADHKKLKELAIWKTRCLKKKIIWEETNCSENLERYASYNLK